MVSKTPTREEAERMAVSFLESACYKDEETDQVLVSLIRKGCVVFTSPDMFQITELGMKNVENGDAGG